MYGTASFSVGYYRRTRYNVLQGFSILLLMKARFEHLFVTLIVAEEERLPSHVTRQDQWEALKHWRTEGLEIRLPYWLNRRVTQSDSLRSKLLSRRCMHMGVQILTVKAGDTHTTTTDLLLFRPEYEQ